MHPRITLITLAVADLEKSLAFYRDGLGLATKGIVCTEVLRLRISRPNPWLQNLLYPSQKVHVQPS